MKLSTGRVYPFLAVPVLLAVALILCEYRAHSSSALQSTGSNRLLRSKQDEVLRITIVGPRPGIPLVLERRSGSWILLLDSETFYPANARWIDSFLDELTKKRKTVGTGRTGGYHYGTTGDGSCTVRIDTAKGQTVIIFGQANADERYRYFRYDGRPIRRTDNGLAPWLDNRTSRWLALSPFREQLAEGSVQRVTLYAGGTRKEIVMADALKIFETSLANLTCFDITNIPPSPEVFFIIECGDTSVIKLSFTRLDEVTLIMNEINSGRSWVTRQTTLDVLLDALTAD